MQPTISIVGAGRVGRALGRRLHQLGWQIGEVATRSIGTARSSVRAIGAGHPADRLSRQLLASDVILIGTPDSAIAKTAEHLAELGGNEWRGKVVLHTSGALDSKVLAPLARAGAATGSMHPMQTFGVQSVPALDKTVFGIEGSSTAIKTARKICRQLGGVAVRLSGSNRATYHAAGSFVCAHVLTLMEAGTRLLMTQGFTRRQAIRALLPLTRQTLDNFERVGARAALTGPMIREDFTTIERHADALKQFSSEYLQAYMAVSRLTASLLSANPKATQARLERVFNPHSNDKKILPQDRGTKGMSNK